MSWTRKINHPSEILKKGETTEAVVLAVDQEAKKITLGLKQLEANPWESIGEFVEVGSVVEATVSKIADFGVFATLENGIECLIHISQLSEKPFQKIEDIVKRGDKVLAKVDRIDRQRRKIALSIREYQRDVRLVEEEAAREAAKALSFGDQSIAGMKEHLEEAMEQFSPPAELHEVTQEIERGAPAAEEPATTSVPTVEDEAAMDWGTGAAPEEMKFGEESPPVQEAGLESEFAAPVESPTTPEETRPQQVTLWGEEFTEPAAPANVEQESLPGEEPRETSAADALQLTLPSEVEEATEKTEPSAPSEKPPELQAPQSETGEDEPPKEKEPAP
jgi:predicted RNA-binding protein with RPS1 domain